MIRPAMPLLKSPTRLAAAVACLFVLPATAMATAPTEPAATAPGEALVADGYLPGADPKPDGYLPNEPHPNQYGDPFYAPAPYVTGGATFSLGFQVPIGGDLHLPNNGPREMRASGNIGGGVFVNFGQRFELEAAIAGGVGGLDERLYEQVFGFHEMDTYHMWIGARARAYLVDYGPVRPFISGQFGGDRLVAVYSEGTGVLECDESYSGRLRCDEVTEREFAAGYWGSSVGLGTGVRFAASDSMLGVIIEGYGVRNRYGRSTNSDIPNQRLEEDSPVVWSGGMMVHLRIGHN